MKKIILMVAILLFIFIAFNGADCSITELINKKPQELNKDDVERVVFGIIDYMAMGASSIAIIYIIIGGIQYMTALGNPSKVTQAKGTLTWAIIGFILIIVSYIIVKFIVDRLNST